MLIYSKDDDDDDEIGVYKSILRNLDFARQRQAVMFVRSCVLQQGLLLSVIPSAVHSRR